jgi:hypothetical protein
MGIKPLVKYRVRGQSGLSLAALTLPATFGIEALVWVHSVPGPQSELKRTQFLFTIILKCCSCKQSLKTFGLE